MVNQYRYTPFGEPRVKAETVHNPYEYAGRRYDDESGKYYYRARQYSPEQARFMSQDPVGDGNRYAYVGNNPVNRRDPSGMQPNQPPMALIDGGGFGIGVIFPAGNDCIGASYETFSSCRLHNSYEECKKMCWETGHHGKSFEECKEEQEREVKDTDININLPEINKIGTKIELSWSKSEAQEWCNHFGNAGTTCGSLADPYSREACFAALALGALPFCICGYLGDGLVLEYSAINGVEKFECETGIRDWLGETSQYAGGPMYPER